jgi:hypothetical protein
MRDRAWRRYIHELVIIKRLKNKTFGRSIWFFEDVNRNIFKKVLISDYLGKEEYFKSKVISTTKWDSKYKSKYSPNKNKTYYREENKKFQTRESKKLEFIKILKEYGLK